MSTQKIRTIYTFSLLLLDALMIVLAFVAAYSLRITFVASQRRAAPWMTVTEKFHIRIVFRGMAIFSFQPMIMIGSGMHLAVYHRFCPSNMGGLLRRVLIFLIFSIMDRLYIGSTGSTAFKFNGWMAGSAF